MSHKKIVELAHKFAKKTVMFNHEQIMKAEKLNMYFEQFKRDFRALLNEMSGEYMSIRIKGIDSYILKEFSTLYHNLLDYFKRFDDQYPYESLQRIVNYVFSKSFRSTITSLNNNIQQFLKENEVDFIPRKGFTQARVESLTKLIALINSAHNFLLTSTPTETSIEDRLQNEKEDYIPPTASSSDKTKT